MLKSIASVLASVAVVGVLVSWLIVFVNLMRIPLYIKVGERVDGRKTNAMFFPEKLTDKGLIVRRWTIFGVVSFFAWLVIALVCGAVAK